MAEAQRLYAEAGYSRDAPIEVELRYNTSTPHRRLALAVAAMRVVVEADNEDDARYLCHEMRWDFICFCED